MASRYVGKIPAAVSGSGGHNQTFMAACALVKGFDLTKDEARPLMQEFNGRCQPPWSDAEIEHKLNQADKIPDEEPRGYLRLSNTAPVGGASAARPAPKPLPSPPKPTFHADRLKTFGARWRDFIDTAWLADRSPQSAYRLTPAEYLTAVFREGEKVVIFQVQKSQGQALWPLDEPPERGELGVWYLDQPVDGEMHPNPRSLDRMGAPKPSRRSEESVSDWRHLVLESDEAHSRDWMAALVQLPLPIVAIYTSGDRSIHALVRVDAPTKQEWDNAMKQMRPLLVTLGACSRALTAVRLTRLPGCWRHGKMIEVLDDGVKKEVYHRFPQPALQKLLYLNPAAIAGPIVAQPRARDVMGHWQAMLSSLDACTPAQAREQGCWEMVEQCRAALEWYEQAPPARAMMARLRAWEAGA